MIVATTHALSRHSLQIEGAQLDSAMRNGVVA